MNPPGAALVGGVGDGFLDIQELKHGKLHDDSWSGLFRQIRAGNNDKTTVAGKGILLAMCHLSPFSCMAISSASQSETRC